MSANTHHYKFDELTKMKKKNLDQLMLQGEVPQVADVIGFEFRGWNLNPITKLSKTLKFKKGFFGQPGLEHAWGYNVPVKQNVKSEAWIAQPDEKNPKRYYFFKVLPGGPRYKYPRSLVIDYSKWDEYFFLNPVQNTVDYMIYPDPTNHDLMVGKSYFKTFLGEIFMGYFIIERRNESNYDRASHFLTKREYRTVEKFSEVFIEGSNEAIPASKIARNIDQQLDRVNSNRKRSLKLILFVIEFILPLPRWRFSNQTASKRKTIIQKTISNPGKKALFRDVAKDLARVKALFLSGYYGDKAVHASINFIPVEEREKFKPDGLKKTELKPLDVEEQDNINEAEISADVCVIGSGAGGAVVAYNAAAAGKKVVLLEEGGYFSNRDQNQRDVVNHNEGEMTAKLFKEGGLQTTVDFDMTILQGKCLGGTTVINNAICLQLKDPDTNPESPDIFERWRELGVSINEAQLNESYKRVGEMINVHRIPSEFEARYDIVGNNGKLLLEGWQKVIEKEPAYAEYKHHRFKKNYQNCYGCGYCIYACPYERKRSMLETYIPKAIGEGARVISKCHAVKIERQGNKVTGVRCESPTGRMLFVHADKVVVAGGAIGSSVLLMKSGIKQNVGSRFSFNAGTPVMAKFPHELNGFDGAQMATYIDCPDFILETLFAPPLGFAVQLPGWFNTHFERMKAYNHFASVGVLIETHPNARVKRSAFFRNLFGPVKYKMTDEDFAKMKRGIILLSKVFFEAGAESVYPASFVDIELKSGDDIEGIIQENIRKRDDLVLNSSHPQGGNPMSDNRSIGVVNSQFQVHGYDNLFVCDASVFPTSIRINPQFTIMAMADYFSHLGVL